jgi:hypothetical protein
LVTGHVSIELCLPELLIASGPFEVFAAVLMPEAPVNKDHSFAGWKDHVRLAGEPTSPKPVAQALRVQGLSQEEFWSCVFAFDASHHAAARGRVNNVGHASE